MHRILNVDDTPALRYAKSKVLRQAGFTVFDAATGRDRCADAAIVPVMAAPLPIRHPRAQPESGLVYTFAAQELGP